MERSDFSSDDIMRFCTLGLPGWVFLQLPWLAPAKRGADLNELFKCGTWQGTARHVVKFMVGRSLKPKIRQKITTSMISLCLLLGRFWLLILGTNHGMEFAAAKPPLAPKRGSVVQWFHWWKASSWLVLSAKKLVFLGEWFYPRTQPRWDI